MQVVGIFSRWCMSHIFCCQLTNKVVIGSLHVVFYSCSLYIGMLRTSKWFILIVIIQQRLWIINLRWLWRPLQIIAVHHCQPCILCHAKHITQMNHIKRQQQNLHGNKNTKICILYKSGSGFQKNTAQETVTTKIITKINNSENLY